MIQSLENNTILVFERFHNLISVYLIKTCQSEGFVLVQCILGNFNMAEISNDGNHNIFSLIDIYY